MQKEKSNIQNWQKSEKKQHTKQTEKPKEKTVYKADRKVK